MSAPALLLAQAAENHVTLTTTGATIMILSVGLVLALNVFCMARILGERRPKEHHHAPLEIDVTHDAERQVRCPNPSCRNLNDAHAECCSRCGGPLPGRQP